MLASTLLGWLAVCAPAAALALSLEIDSLTLSGLRLEGLRLRVEAAPTGDTPRLIAAVQRLEAPGGLRWTALAIDCRLRSRPEAGRDRCEGRLLGLAEPLQLSLEQSASAWSLELASPGLGRVQLDWDGGNAIGLRLERSSLAALLDLLPVEQRPALPIEARLSGRLRLDWPGAGPWRIEGPLALAELALQFDEAGLAGEAIRLEGRFAMAARDEGMDAVWRSRITAGELLAGPVFVDFGEGAVDLDVQLLADAAGQVQRVDLLLHDPDRLSLDARVELAAGQEPTWAVQSIDWRLPGALDRYGSDPLAALGFRGLESSGRIRVAARGQGSTVDRLMLEFDDVWLDDPDRRIGIAGLYGRLAPGEAAAQRLGWQGLSLYGLPLGAAELELQGARGGLELLRPASIPALGGMLGIDALFWHRERDEHDPPFGLALSARQLSMVELSQRLGWPQMGGTLGGTLPGLRLRGGVIEVDGALDVELFDGRVRIENLALERPFGVLPTLAADLSARGLDLRLVTGTFAFGAIEGRLDADVTGLRLLDWRPVAFDAFLRTSTTAPGPRRLSQRAVDSLSALGGAGGVAALQQTALRFFESFRYEQIGLRCRLRDHVCEMSGIGPADEGYYIVRGSGLPRLNVIGFERQVDWPVLLARLRQATEGGVRVGGG